MCTHSFRSKKFKITQMDPLDFCRWRQLKSPRSVSRTLRSRTPFGRREVTADPYALAHEDVVTVYTYPRLKIYISVPI
jgi:hypothetical protein